MSGCLPCFGKHKKYACETPESDTKPKEEKITKAEQNQNNTEPVLEEPQPLSPSKAELKAAFFAETSPKASEEPSDPFKEKAEKAEKERKEREEKLKKEKEGGQEEVIEAKASVTTEAAPSSEPSAETEAKIEQLKKDLENLEEARTEQFILQALRVVKGLQGQNLSDKMSGDLNGIVNKLESLVSRLETVASKQERGGGGGDDDNANVQAYDDQVVGGKLKEYFRLSTEIGGEVAEHAALVREGYATLRALLISAGKHKQPSKDDLPKALGPLSTMVSKIQEFADKRPASKVKNQLQTVKEAIPAIGWVSVPKPGNYVKEIKDQAMFYGNRVVKDYKGVDDKHVEWWRALCGSLVEMTDFVKDSYPIGLTWNNQGQPWAAGAPAAGGAPPPPPPGGAPPPPPPPAVLPPTSAPSKSSGEQDAAARGALFASLNQGTDITRGLKKVTKDMQTHKNPGLRAGATVPGDNAKPAPAAKPAGGAAKKGTPKFELEGGKKWVVEYQSNNQGMTIEGNTKQTVYVYKCDNSTLQIKGKLNNVILDSCNKVGVVVEDVISTVEFVNCQRVKGQIDGAVPCISIDKTDGIEVYLNEKSLKTEIVSAKSSAMNLCIVDKEGDLKEFPLPEQYKSAWNGKSFATTVMDQI